jgi:PUA domain protein
MFRKFTKEENIKTTSPVRSSEQRAIRGLVLQQYPALEPYADDLFPKKDSLIVCKWCAAARQ